LGRLRVFSGSAILIVRDPEVQTTIIERSRPSAFQERFGIGGQNKHGRLVAVTGGIVDERKLQAFCRNFDS
jgi:hypothetical protein